MKRHQLSVVNKCLKVKYTDCLVSVSKTTAVEPPAFKARAARKRRCSGHDVRSEDEKNDTVDGKEKSLSCQ